MVRPITSRSIGPRRGKRYGSKPLSMVQRGLSWSCLRLCSRSCYSSLILVRTIPERLA